MRDLSRVERIDKSPQEMLFLFVLWCCFCLFSSHVSLTAVTSQRQGTHTFKALAAERHPLCLFLLALASRKAVTVDFGAGRECLTGLWLKDSDSSAPLPGNYRCPHFVPQFSVTCDSVAAVTLHT